MKPAKPASGSAPRRPYDVAALQTIFSSPLYIGCRSETKRWEPGTHVAPAAIALRPGRTVARREAAAKGA